MAPLDFTQGPAVAAAWQRIHGEWGGCDLTLVVAGTHREFRAWDLTEAGADALLETNLNGPLATVAAVLPGLIAQGRGAIAMVLPASPATEDCRRRWSTARRRRR